MPSFPYKKRAPRTPPEAPEPETPQNSDWRLYNAMLRLFFSAAILVALYAAVFARGGARGIGTLVAMVLALLYLVVPDFRSRINGSNAPWWFMPSDSDDFFDGDDTP